jgi:sirohydrochlorin ferrochelatase
VEGLSILPGAYEAAISQANLQPVDKHHAFLSVLKRDAGDALAAMELVLAQPAISSQLIDNLNASIHLRALLTDLFLIDEIAKLHQSSADKAISAEI